MGDTEPQEQTPEHEPTTLRFKRVVRNLTADSDPAKRGPGDAYSKVREFKVTSKKGLMVGFGEDISNKRYRYVHAGIEMGERHAIGLGSKPDEPPEYVFLNELGSPLQLYKDGVFVASLNVLDGDETTQDLIATFAHLTLQVEERLHSGELERLS